LIPHPQSTGFDLANALALARLAALAYRPAGEVHHDFDRITHPAVRVQCFNESSTGTQGFIATDDDCAVIAFAGTQGDDIKDWITDLRFRRRKSKMLGGSVHGGFLAAIRSVSDQIDSLISRFHLKPGIRVFITGHSLGGALAMLCGSIFQASISLRFSNPQIYTFGQPRVGNSEFVADYQARLGEHTWRFVHEEDIVPRLPLWLMGFRHAGHEVFLPSFPSLPGSADYLFDPDPITKVFSDIIGLWQAWQRKEDTLVRDHFMASYLARLESFNQQLNH
jgi:hypothetical protein